MKYNCTDNCETLNEFLNNCHNYLNKNKKYITHNNNNNVLSKMIYEFLNNIGNNITIVKTKSIHTQLYIENNTYMSNEIRQHIVNQRDVQVIKYTLKFYNKKVIINYYLIDNNTTEYDLNNHIKFIAQFVQLIYYITKYKHNNNIIDIYLTNNKKNITYNKITKKNINSGFCLPNDINRKIIIYRYEEYIKVFIHEFLHSCHIDYYMYENRDRINHELIYKKFNFDDNKTEIMLSETYTEFWCNVIYISIFSYNYMKNSTQNISLNNYINIYDKLMEKQIIFSVLQTVKILDIYNIQYLDTINNYKHNYNETTHVLSYYYFKTLLLFKYKDIIHMCNKNIIGNEKTVKNITEYLIEIINNKKLINLFNLYENFLKKNKNKNKNKKSFLFKNLYMCYIEI